MKILWMNWRCIKHPLAGGAEVYTHEVAERLVSKGYEIVLITSRAPGLLREEVIDGYRVVRVGGRYTVYLRARDAYRELRKRGWVPDIVIDEINTIPFLTPLYVSQPIAVLIHQLCKDCWRYAVHPLAQPFGWWLEKKLHRIYVKACREGRVGAVITVSPSTKRDLVELGYPESSIHIAYNGLDWGVYGKCVEICGEKQDIVTYLGRITPYKRVEDLLRAWRFVERETNAELVVAGRADPKYLRKLVELAKKLNLKRVSFRTNLSQREKMELLAKAKILVYTSTREGWGQTILEAAACRTPAIAYNVPGLRDAVKHMETGMLVELGDLESLAKAITTLLTDSGLREKIAENAYRYARGFSWDRTAEEFLNALRSIVS